MANLKTNSSSKAKPKSTEQAQVNSAVQAIFPIVGIGASAGGLSAFESFFSGLPKDREPGMAFVLVQHLSPDHKSILAEIIKRYTRLQVFEVEDGMRVQINCAYIIPPNREMAIINGTLHLFNTASPRGQFLPIDNFFRTLASDLRERSICIVLSGTGSDGTLGLRAIKSEGGLVIVQRPDSAEFDGMPKSAIATGLVDYELTPDTIAEKIIAYCAHALDTDHGSDLIALHQNENAISKVFVLIRDRTGHDFSKYKLNSIYRRIEHRLAVLQIKTVDEYVNFLQLSPNEYEVLFRDILIGVTSFFRDSETFQKLQKEIIPSLFTKKPEGATIRVWCPGCSTGEEAYSIAILLKEHSELLKKHYVLQVFATDIDSRSIVIARAAKYSINIASYVSPDRLNRFFTEDTNSNEYRINKNIRDMLIFSEQSVIKDPPFSKIDLITCRNLLIYFNSELQKKTIQLFHYALNPEGILFLGSSEGINNSDQLFRTLDRKLKIYQRKEDFPDNPRVSFAHVLSSSIGDDKSMQNSKTIPNSQPRQSLKEIIEQIVLKECALSGALVYANGDILYLHGRTGLYLEPNPGESGINNILKMAREGLQRELTLALNKADVNRETVRLSGVNVRTNGHFSHVNLIIKPVMIGVKSITDKHLFVVIFEEVKNQEAFEITQTENSIRVKQDLDLPIEELRAELRIKEDYLQAANAQLESSIEELKLTNEELQSVNEEMQSTNEELETSKEELQSINEEITTVNSELQVKVHDLSQANNDMNNLLAGTNIATVFLDCQQNIMRFTPAANKIINIILGDVGRPVAHIVTNLVGYNQMTADVKYVLDTLIPKSVEVQTQDGNWYKLIIQPYRTCDNVIEGAVVTFVDITEMKLALDKLSISELSYRTLFETAREGILILNAQSGRIEKINPYLLDLLGYNENQIMEKSIWEIGLFEDILRSKEKLTELQVEETIRYEDLPLQTADGRKIQVEFISSLIQTETHKIIQCNIREFSILKK